MNSKHPHIPDEAQHNQIIRNQRMERAIDSSIELLQEVKEARIKKGKAPLDETPKDEPGLAN